MKLCLERVEEMLVSLSAFSHWKQTCIIIVHPSSLLIPWRVTMPNPPAVLSGLTVQNAISQRSSSAYVFDSHLLWVVWCVCLRGHGWVHVPSVLKVLFYESRPSRAQGQTDIPKANASPFTIRMGSCILFAYHIQKRTQNGSQSPLEGQGEMKIEDRGDKKKKKKRLDLRHSCQVVMQIVFRNMAVKVNPSLGGIHFKIPWLSLL